MSKRTRNEASRRVSRSGQYSGAQRSPADRYFERQDEISAKRKVAWKNRKAITLPKLNLPEWNDGTD